MREDVLILFVLEGLIVEGKSMSLLKFVLLFRCVFEAIFKVKVNLGFHKCSLPKLHVLVVFSCLI
jgi:hypothetical protein